MITEAIQKVVNGENLGQEQAEAVMSEIMTGDATPAQIGALLAALRLKRETADEICGFARAMHRRAEQVPTRHRFVIDTCGTGGDGARTFNISTTAALVVAAAGVPVAKHGNTSVSSRCGSADVLRQLGVNLEVSPFEMGACLDSVGIAFLFAPRLHPAMRHAAGARREIGIRTVFNILGPLTNPLRPRAQVLGVFDPATAELVAGALAELDIERAFVVHGSGGLDELSLAGPSLIWEVRSGSVRPGTLDPAELGFERTAVACLSGGSPADNAVLTRGVLSGERGPRRDAVLLNAGLALVAAGSAGGMPEAVRLAAETIDSGAARQKLESLIEFTQRCTNAEHDHRRQA
ncbi:MAG: anthranilate phosphoribosyltransferase [Candidatus Desulforudis sp.]|nr:anthranilate phosphoribosyltransferase [Desulforudis sp.]